MNSLPEHLNNRLEHRNTGSWDSDKPSDRLQAPVDPWNSDPEVDALADLARRLQSAPPLRVDPDFARHLERRVLIRNAALHMRQPEHFWVFAYLQKRHLLMKTALSLCVLILLLGTGILVWLLRVNSTTNQAESNDQFTQGVIVQVDHTNSKEVTFSLLDQHGVSQTFHLTAQTQFAQALSASQLKVNTFVRVKTKFNATWGFDALQVQLQSSTQKVFDLQGVVASINYGLKWLTLALNDGTMLSVTLDQANLNSLQPGSLISLQAHFTVDGSLVASTFRILSSHTQHFTARGIISYINPRTHRLTLVTVDGASFTIVQPYANENSNSHSDGLRVGALVEVTGSTDGQGNLTIGKTSVYTPNEPQETLSGMVSAIDSIANTFSLIDQEGNDLTLKADSHLLLSLTVGGVYQLKATNESDGSVVLGVFGFLLGNDRGAILALEGIVQTYDASSGVLSFAGQNGQSFTLVVTSQTTIYSDNEIPPQLSSGQAIHCIVQHTTASSYTIISIKIEQDSGHQGDELTFSGTLRGYNAASGKLTISTDGDQTLSFWATSGTVVLGATSLDAIASGTPLQIVAQVQQNGSYQALKVEVQVNQSN